MDKIGMDWEESLDLLVTRMGDRDRLEPGQAHEFFKDLVPDLRDQLWDTWAWEAFEELKARGYLALNVSDIQNGGDAFGRLSANGRNEWRALKAEADETEEQDDAEGDNAS